MTTKKDLKAHIRARCAKTGESYTAARRHILKQEAGPDPAAAPERLPPAFVAFHSRILLVRGAVHKAGTIAGRAVILVQHLPICLDAGAGHYHVNLESATNLAGEATSISSVLGWPSRYATLVGIAPGEVKDAMVIEDRDQGEFVVATTFDWDNLASPGPKEPILSGDQVRGLLGLEENELHAVLSNAASVGRREGGYSRCPENMFWPLDRITAPAKWMSRIGKGQAAGLMGAEAAFLAEVDASRLLYAATVRDAPLVIRETWVGPRRDGGEILVEAIHDAAESAVDAWSVRERGRGPEKAILLTEDCQKAFQVANTMIG